MNLVDDGILVIKEFLSSYEVNLILNETDCLFHGNYSETLRASYIRSVSLGFCSRDIPDVGNAVRSINLYEKAINVFEHITSELNNYDSGQNFKLTMLSCSMDHSPLPLALHSDHLDFEKLGMFRALLYLSDVGLSSGCFRYCPKTHLSNHLITHGVPKQQSYEDIAIDLCGKPGDLIIFNAYGIHGRRPCKDPRISLTFEFLPSHLAQRNNGFSLTPGHLTPKVISQINLFANPLFTSQSRSQFFVGDNMSHKFWSPLTQYTYHAAQYVSFSHRVLIKALITLILRLMPANLLLIVKRLVFRRRSYLP